MYDAYFALLREWNGKINLVSRKSIETSFAYHFADSVWIAQKAFECLEGRSLRDLGTGAGFPGLVFAIRFPEVAVCLYEKLAKRRLFLQEVITQLGLSRVTLYGALPDQLYTDLFTARAVLPVPELFPFMHRHFRNGGRLLVSLGGGVDIPEAPKPYRLLSTGSYELPEGAGNRKIAVYEHRST